MWRMIRAGLMGILIGVVGGAIVGQVYYSNYLKNRKDSRTVSAIAYNEASDAEGSNGVIRLNVNYKGKENLSKNEEKELIDSVEKSVLYALASRLGDDYSENMSLADIKHEIIMAYEYISSCADECAKELGIDTNTQTKLEYKYYQGEEFDGLELPAGFYETLAVTLDD
ncbi:MAG: stage II sporulation protein R [Coprococcus sp.]